jgi:hypothetical protein
MAAFVGFENLSHVVSMARKEGTFTEFAENNELGRRSECGRVCEEESHGGWAKTCARRTSRLNHSLDDSKGRLWSLPGVPSKLVARLAYSDQRRPRAAASHMLPRSVFWEAYGPVFLLKSLISMVGAQGLEPWTR